jgi:hypothetical protein
MNLSIITAAIPSLHRFLNDLQHGAIGVRITEHQYELSQGSSNALSSGKFHRSSSKKASRPPTEPRFQGLAGGAGTTTTRAGSLTTSGTKLSSRIFSDHHTAQRAHGHHHHKPDHHHHHPRHHHDIPEVNSTSSLTNNHGVLQTWEISVEVTEDTAHKKNNNNASIATTADSLAPEYS